MVKMVRGIITEVTEGEIKRFSGTGRPGETFMDRELFQHYGLTSRPKADAEIIALKQGNVVVAIASDDRRYRIKLQEGEVCIYTDEGDFVHFKRGKEIHISTGNKLLIDATNEVEINAPEINLNGDVNIVGDVTLDGTLQVSGDVTLDSKLDVTGNINTDGTIDAVGNINSDGSIIDTTGNTNNHSHP